MNSNTIRTALGLYFCVMLAACAATMGADQDALVSGSEFTEPTSEEQSSQTEIAAANDDPEQASTNDEYAQDVQDALFCTYETQKGTRFKKRVCRSQRQLEARKQDSQNYTRQSQRPVGS